MTLLRHFILAGKQVRSEVETAHAGTSPAPDITVTVAPFRAWRGSRLIVAEKPTRAAIELMSSAAWPDLD